MYRRFNQGRTQKVENSTIEIPGRNFPPWTPVVTRGRRENVSACKEVEGVEILNGAAMTPQFCTSLFPPKINDENTILVTISCHVMLNFQINKRLSFLIHWQWLMFTEVGDAIGPAGGASVFVILPFVCFHFVFFSRTRFALSSVLVFSAAAAYYVAVRDSR